MLSWSLGRKQAAGDIPELDAEDSPLRSSKMNGNVGMWDHFQERCDSLEPSPVLYTATVWSRAGVKKGQHAKELALWVHSLLFRDAKRITEVNVAL